ncbi:MAG TPA: hypothetical protein VIL85_19425 [Thermomicrobiales bacterium]|jgi:hypothetical protein
MSEQGVGAGGRAKFDPSRYLRQARGRDGGSDYLGVKWRLVWLRSEHPDAQISTEHVTITSDMAIFKALVAIPGGGSATGYGAESAKDFGDFIEKAETKALGRALLALGFDTQAVQDLGDDDVAEPAPPLRPLPTRAEVARNEAPARPITAPQPAVAQRTPSVPVAPRSEQIPADLRRQAPVRPLREVESADTLIEPDPIPDLVPDVVSAERREVVVEAPMRVVEPPPARPQFRPTSPQPAVRPAPRPTPAAAAAPGFSREPVDDGEDEVVDLANYGWTEFWSWARARGFNDRKSLDAVVGRPTNGMTPLEIRKQIQAKQN